MDNLTAEGKAFFEELKKLVSMEVCVGFQAGQASHDGVDMCDIAMWNELGTVRSPSRPFLRQSVEGEFGENAIGFLEEQVEAIMEGASAEMCLKQIGVFQKGQVQESILSGDFTPNAPSTVKKKGSSQPLIDEGKMLQSVNYVVRKKGE